MKTLFYLLIIFPISQQSHAQVKGDKTIRVQDVGFTQVCNALLDAGFIIDKKDDDLQTVKTEFKDGTGNNKWMKLLLTVRLKDSVAIITGSWYNSTVIGTKLLGQEQTIENNTAKIEYTNGNPKRCFNEMKAFALSLGKQITYSKQ